MSPITRLFIFCDGTWCGRDTQTTTNIHLLARMVGLNPNGPDSERELYNEEHAFKARYFDGIGLGSSFLAYLFNGATANDIGTMCEQVYTYIVRNYEPGAEIWMFGLSRGSYTVRCVGGMINNCGIINRNLFGSGSGDELESLCKAVYRIYCSPYEEDKPQSKQTGDFRKAVSWDVKTPIKFLGLLDTVGSVGIPTLEAGNGPVYPTLWDQVVSSEVENVYHAVSLHDRLSLFQPCLTQRNKFSHTKIYECWFPGCHYDLGRQKFNFFRAGAAARKAVVVLSDVVLLWMLEAIDTHCPDPDIFHGGRLPQYEPAALQRAIANPKKSSIGSGDVYSSSLTYLPFGRVLGLFNKIDLFGATEVVKLLLAVRDRRIPSRDAEVYPYDLLQYGETNRTVAQLAGVDGKRYPSKTAQTWRTWCAAFDVDMDGTS
ncbi:hypothetical protein H2203_007127 [Taxawa tesnikishii (nom. ined.)]|nr:hypothetical protein H2203_007127 [Dothideales sp. JES 119]